GNGPSVGAGERGRSDHGARAPSHCDRGRQFDVFHAFPPVLRTIQAVTRPRGTGFNPGEANLSRPRAQTKTPPFAAGSSLGGVSQLARRTTLDQAGMRSSASCGSRSTHPPPPTLSMKLPPSATLSRLLRRLRIKTAQYFS